MKSIDDYTIGELKEIIQQREEAKADWKEQAKGKFMVLRDGCNGRYYIDKNAKFQEFYATNNEALAEILARRIDLMNRMYLYAIIANTDERGVTWRADWCNNDQKKWGLSSSGYRFTTDYDYVYNSFLFGIAVKSREIAEAMLEEFRDELEIYLN